MKDRSKNFPSLKDILNFGDPDVTTRGVGEGDHDSINHFTAKLKKKGHEVTRIDPTTITNLPDNNRNIEGGICGGLSVVHILSQLQSKTSFIKNPIRDYYKLKEATEIQEECDDKLQCFKKVLLNNNSYKPYKRCDADALEHKLQKLVGKVNGTEEDERSRGILITTDINRDPHSGEKRNFDAGHGISMTVQKHNNQLFCTGMDSNLFFATGKGESGCNKIAKKMADTVNAYDAHNVYTVTVTEQNVVKTSKKGY